MTIGEKIKMYRLRSKISQRELGRRIGKTGQFISLIEQDASQPSTSTLIRIATVLNISSLDLILYDKCENKQPEREGLKEAINSVLEYIGYELIFSHNDGDIKLLSDIYRWDISVQDYNDMQSNILDFLEYQIYKLTKDSEEYILHPTISNIKNTIKTISKEGVPDAKNNIQEENKKR